MFQCGYTLGEPFDLVGQHLERHPGNGGKPLVSLVANDTDQRLDLSGPLGRDDTKLAEMTTRELIAWGTRRRLVFRSITPACSRPLDRYEAHSRPRYGLTDRLCIDLSVVRCLTYGFT